MTHKELIVWKKAFDLVINIYQLTDLFPTKEQFGLVHQMRRAAVSIPSNIAEGYGRKSSKEYAHHLSIAFGSALELETQLLLSKKLLFAREEAFEKIEQLMDEVLRMLNKMTVTTKKS